MALVLLDSSDNFNQFIDKFNNMSTLFGDADLLSIANLVERVNNLDSDVDNNLTGRLIDIYDSAGNLI